PPTTHDTITTPSADPATAGTYPLSLHDALPILLEPAGDHRHPEVEEVAAEVRERDARRLADGRVVGRQEAGEVDVEVRLQRGPLDRKSTRLNSSHVSISYAVFCLKKKN